VSRRLAGYLGLCLGAAVLAVAVFILMFGGAILTGVLATSAVNGGLGKDHAGHLLPLGLVDGKASQVLNQMVGCGISWTIAVAGTLVILKVCDVVIGLRVSPEHEMEGLDLSQHGEEGYIFES